MGSAGDATYRNVRGRTIMSARVRHNSSNTPMQAERRSIFALAQGIWALYRFWPEMAFEPTQFGSRVNAANKYNMGNIEAGAQAVGRKEEEPVIWQLLNKDSTLHVQAAKGSLPYVGTSLASSTLLPNLSNCNVLAFDPSAIAGVTAPAITFMAFTQLGQNSSLRPYALSFVLELVSKAVVQAKTSASILADGANGKLYCFIDDDTLLKVVFPCKVTGSSAWNSHISSYMSAAALQTVSAANVKVVGFNTIAAGFRTISIEDKVASLAR